MCCCCNARVASILAGIYTALVSAILIGIFVVFYFLHDCSLQLVFDGVPIVQDVLNIFYYIYFYNADCGKIEFPLGTNITFPETVVPADRTHTWTLVYIALNGAWLLSSFLLLGGCSGYPNRNKCLAYPWILVTTGVVTCDIATSAIYGSDIDDTKTLERLFTFMNITGDLKLPDQDVPEYITSIPSIIMTLVFAKLGVFWIITVCALFSVTCGVALSKKARKKPDLFLHTRPPPEDFYTPAHHNPAFEVDEQGSCVSDEALRQTYEQYPRMAHQAYPDSLHRDPKYESYLQSLNQQSQPVRSHVPWSYIRPNSTEQQHVSLELHTPPSVPRQQGQQYVQVQPRYEEDEAYYYQHQPSSYPREMPAHRY